MLTYKNIICLVLICGLPAQASSVASTENLKQWILEHRSSLPVSAQEAIVSASESDFTSTILKLLGFNGDNEQDGVISASSSFASSEITNNELSKKQNSKNIDNLKTTLDKNASKNGVKVSERDVCPFNADPLVITGDYVFCKQSNLRDCPLGFVCDQSFVLGRPICCQDLRPKTISTNNLPRKPNPVVTTTKSTYEWSTKTPVEIATPITSAPQVTSTVKETTTTQTSETQKPSETTSTVVETSTAKITATPEQTTTPTTNTKKVEPAKPRNPWNHLWTTTIAPDTKVKVSVLQTGNIRLLKDSQREMSGAITLIQDNGVNILVDTGASSDTERLLLALTKEGVTLDNIDTVVITHAHPNHMGNLNFFGRKPILFHSLEYIGKHVISTELKERPYRKITTNVEIWKTPGHTQHDLSVLVHGVSGYGTMAVVGDLIPSEKFISEKIDIMNSDGVWDSATKRQNANLIICMADWIVPGHGIPFRILPHYRQKAGCTRLLAQRKRSSTSNCGAAEALAFDSISAQDFNVTISKQDVASATFAHRHAMLVDQNTDEVYVPLKI
uniref:Lactamase_B domain-containing protein n=1 Tax=Rhabditophanes sp. KR3021 TaxID=114890 RepID=A0AC35TLF7_9BILA